MKRISVFLICLFLVQMVFAGEEDLTISPGNAYIEVRERTEGLDLYIRAVDGLGSILITESTADPEKQAASFAFRAWDYNSVNGDERRILDGEFLESPDRELYFLLDSTPEPNELLDSAFHIYIPLELTYGYPWSREGQIQVHQGTWLNIRAFEKPYADYSGAWQDNPFVLTMKELPPPPEAPPEPEDPPQTVEIPEETENISVTNAVNTEQAVELIADIMTGSGGNIDVVLVIDTTVSMKDDLDFLKQSLIPLVRDQVSGFDSFRVGTVLYRDYKEAYLTRTSPFTPSLEELQSNLNRITVSGGRDLPEAVHEGIYAGLTEFEWEAPNRVIVQVGDAPAHEEPRGAITETMVRDEAARLNVRVHTVNLPGDNIKPEPEF